MSGLDVKEVFQKVPWASALINVPNTICRVPSCRFGKSTSEDALIAGTLRTSRTFKSVVAFYKRPDTPHEQIAEVTTLLMTGSGVDGYAGVMHGGIVAVVMDEGIGIYMSANQERNHLIKVQRGLAEGELPPHSLTAMTAELNIKYFRPVQTPGIVMVKARTTIKEGRKERLVAEVWQTSQPQLDSDNELLLCARGEALFIEPRDPKL